MSRTGSNLLDILLNAPSQRIREMPDIDLGQAEVEPFPFLAISGQYEMKLALMLALINPRVGGVLLIGPRGTAKTTAVRSMADLLPTVRRSLCLHGCTEQMMEEKGMESVCDDCAQKFGHGDALTVEDKVRIIELPLNSRMDDVVGGINERIALEQNRVRLERGILSHADGNILFIDEVNLLDDAIADAILDAATQGHYTVRRGPMRLQYRARILLIGSMNPAEGELRPQLMDRFGLRAVVGGLKESELRYQVYENTRLYSQNPVQMTAMYAGGTLELANDIQKARQLLPSVQISEEAKALGLELVAGMEIESSRAEITLFEAARAHAAADERDVASEADIQAVALLSLRQRTSTNLQAFFVAQAVEDERIALKAAREWTPSMDAF